MLILAFSSEAQASRTKLTFFVGNYNYTATSGSASGFGTYSLNASFDVSKKTQVFGGATITLSKFITGQAGFGVDFGARYYLFTEAGVSHEAIQGVTTARWAVWRPFVGLAFRQRTFAATSQATYIGLGFLAGVDRQLNETLSLSLQLGYDKLTGPASASATQLNALIGLSVYFE
jgi:hypothetical protein